MYAIVAALSFENFDEELYYLGRYGVLICKQHSTVLQKVEAHPRKHHGIRGSGRRGLVRYCSRYRFAAPSAITLPPPLGSPIAELGEPLDGFQCRWSSSFSFITVSLVESVRGETDVGDVVAVGMLDDDAQKVVSNGFRYVT
ncbi:hypothetical protein PMIN06_010656 [Paraphaeosphaeria minitans]